MSKIVTKEDLIKVGLQPKKKNWYEIICGFLEKLPIPVPAIEEEKMQEAITFSHLEITPRGPILLSTIFILFSFILSIILTVTGLISIILTFILFIAIICLGYYFLKYPYLYASHYRIKASSEMVLAVLYMTVSMKVKSNLENAVVFTASNLKGPLKTDLTEIIWNVYNGRYHSFEQGLDEFIKKWKLENQEFTQAVNLIKTSIYQGFNEREKALDEAIRIVLDGTKNRMKSYSRELRGSLMILNALGILLPIIGLMFFPMITVFMPNAIKPIFMVIGYNIILPIVVLFLMLSLLKKRPATFHQPEIIFEKKSGIRRFLDISIIIPILITLIISGFGLYKVKASVGQFNFLVLLYSMMILIGVSLGLSSHFLISSMQNLKKKNEIVEMENELHMVLYQIGYQLRSGGSIENNILKTKSKIQELKISKLFNLIIENIQMFGVTFRQALFNLENGAIFRYPSNLISAIFKAISEMASSGSKALSDSIISISNYLKDMREIEEYLEEVLAEVTTTLRIQAFILAPLASGIVVALAAMMINMILNVSGWAESFQNQLASYGPVGTLGGGIFKSVLEVDKILSIPYFQLIVGFYMLEVVIMITLFLCIIKYGDEKIQRKYEIGKSILSSVIIYSVVVILLYLILTSLIKFSAI